MLKNIFNPIWNNFSSEHGNQQNNLTNKRNMK